MYIFFLIFGGILALGLGAELIIRSSVNLANIYKVSGYFIGFTVIALGTSLPELASTFQALNITDSAEIALGNIIGSNVANILLILGFVSIINPIIFSDKKGQKNQTLIILFVTIIATFIFFLLSNNQSINAILYGVILIFIFFVFLLLQYKNEKLDQNTISQEKNFSQFYSYILIIIGLFLLFYGSKYFIIGSKEIANYFKISDSIIGLTLVAIGTSLPELATGILAAIRKQSNLAVGTILGSNVYNIVGIFALILFIRPNSLFSTSTILLNNIVIMTIITFLFVYKVRFGFDFIKIKAFHLGKNSGFFFLLLYIVYLSYNYLIIN